MKGVFSNRLIAAMMLMSIPAGLNGQIIETTGSTPVMDGEYNVMNNVWGASTAQRLEVDLDGTYFKVVLSEHNNPGSSVASYPAIFKGCHWGWCTTKDNPMPIRVDEVDSAPFTLVIDTEGVLGTWNCAFEAWFNETGAGTVYDGELMIWIKYNGGAGPAGSKVATVDIGGHSWDVYYTQWDWNYIAYKITSVVDSVTLDLKEFMHDALTRGYLCTPWYLVSMEAGFEIWSQGQGLTTYSYSAFVVEGASDENYAPAPFLLMSPYNNKILKSMAIPFTWQKSVDANLDSVEYIFHLFGQDLDTTITKIEDDSLYFDGSNCLLSNTTYTWYVEATDKTDTTASTTQWVFKTPKQTGVDLSDGVPGQFSLEQNHPNPFNSQTEIIFEIKNSALVDLSVYNLLGEKVVTLKTGFYMPGQYQVLFDASRLSSGVYYYRLMTPGQCLSRKCLYIK